MLDPALDARRVALDADRDAVVHRHRERLRAAHAAEAGGQRDGPGQRAAELLVGDRREGLVGALQDALGADVDPRAGRHLAVHRQPEVLEPAELLPVGPVADQVGVRDQHPRRPLVGLHHADRLAGLDEHRLVVRQRPQRAHQRVVRLPVARRLAGAAVDDEVLGALGVVGVEVVHQHPQRRLGLPRAAGQLGAGGGVDGSRVMTVLRSRTRRPRARRRTGRARRRPRSRARGGGRGRGPRCRTSGAGATTAPVAGDGSSGARRSSARAAVRTSIATTRESPSTERRSLRAADHPIETWSSCIALDGMESTEAGTARRLSSETIAAWVYWAIMCPLSTPGSSARNGGRPWLRALSRNRSVRRSLIEATSAATIARKSRT